MGPGLGRVAVGLGASRAPFALKTEENGVNLQHVFFNGALLFGFVIALRPSVLMGKLSTAFQLVNLVAFGQ